MIDDKIETKLKTEAIEAIISYQKDVNKYLVENGITEDKWDLLNLDQKLVILNKTTELLGTIATSITKARHDAILTFDPISIVLKAGDALDIFVKLATLSANPDNLDEIQRIIKEANEASKAKTDGDSFH